MRIEHTFEMLKVLRRTSVYSDDYLLIYYVLMAIYYVLMAIYYVLVAIYWLCTDSDAH
jgi:hypothetical protein